MSRRIERVIVDECVGPATTAVTELHRQSGVARAEFVFLAVEHPGIPDAEILNKLLDAGSGRRPSRRVHGAKVPLPT